MKLYIYFLLLFTFLFQDDSFKLDGRYKLEYDNRNLPHYFITFNDTVYIKKSPRFINTIKGKINYKGNVVTMYDENSNLMIDFFKNDLKKDTIRFGTKDLKGIGSYLHISINSGKLIKIKD